MKDPMLDEVFLHELDAYPHKFIWAKIIALNWDEYPLEEITGRITSGSINVDGASALRRTCSLTLTASKVNINNFYWSLNTKFKVEIGLENWINSEYPDIIWFKQGTFIISTFNCSAGINNYTINIQGKDKMVLLNGEVGGIVPASWDFGTEDVTMEDGTIQNKQIPIKDIVLQAVHEYAQEGWQNIIVNDLDDYGIELLEYEGGTPLYYIIQYDGGANDSREVLNMTLNGDMKCWLRNDTWGSNGRIVGNWLSDIKISEIENLPGTENTSTAGRPCYEKLMEQLDPNGAVTETRNYMRAIISFVNPDSSEFDAEKHLCTIARITKDNGLQVCGYRICDIVYPYDLIASPGEALTSVLDKLVKMLGNFEYFYDVEGRFIFQKKKVYLDVSYNNILNEHSINDEVWANNSEFSSKYSYTFDKNFLVSSFQNSPNLSNLKNDYSLWGKRKQGDIEVPVHMRYAIDHKPLWYKSMGNKESDVDVVYCTEEGYAKYGWSEDNPKIVDWREVIFQMANDYRRHYRDDDFLITLRDKNKVGTDYLYPKGYTGYEKYYIDFEMNLSQGVVAYWRELYNPNAAGKTGRYIVQKGEDGINRNIFEPDEDANVPDWENPKEDENYKTEIQYRAKKAQLVEDLNNAETQEAQEGILAQIDDLEENWEKTGYAKDIRVRHKQNIYRSLIDHNVSEPGSTDANWLISIGDFTYNSDGWNPDILNNPEILNFWFDFLDTDGELNKYSVCNIGQRSKAANDDTIKAIYFRETPNVIFELADDIRQANWVKPGYAHIRIPEGLNNMFSISSRGKNAMDVVQEYLYNYTYPATAITLNVVPIYYLTPNTLIYVDDKATNTVGEYIMQKFSIQFGTASQMTINAVETAKRIY